MPNTITVYIVFWILAVQIITGCSLNLTPSDKPIVINLNIKVDHDVQIRDHNATTPPSP
ncbi:MAG: YnbE family lipoprotein [Magnetococcales bacterium]|nr:YnbE family lipoprotein [Magnetococcales bacterium]